MGMSATTKFLFDTDFSSDNGGRSAIAVAERALMLAEAEAAAHRRGYAEAQADAHAESERRIAGALDQIAAALAAANGAMQAIETRLECEAVEVAVAVARKLTPALIEREPFAEIAALASDCFRHLISSPHVAVRVNDTLYAAAKEKLDDIARARNFEGRLVVLAEADIAPGDCRIEWADGGINRDSAAADAAIGEAVAGYISARRGFAATQAMPRRPEND
jgi:flagellar assembly protein FliH